MKKEKIKFLDNIVCGIHTLAISTDEVICCQSEKAMKCIKADKSKINKETGEITYKAIINPNKWNGWILSYEQFGIVLNEIMQDIGINSYRLARFDLANDSLEDSYLELHKLNKCICLLISLTNRMTNRYESTDPLTFEHLTTRVQNDYYECENYNKGIESLHTSPVYNRLELRTKALIKKSKSVEDIPTLILNWGSMLDKACEHFTQLQDLCNEHLIARWHDENGVKVKSVSEFIRKYSDNIYTSKQLQDLYSKLGYDNSKAKAKNFKRSNKKYIEYITKNDLMKYISILKKVQNDYINGVQKGVSDAPLLIVEQVA